MIYVKEYNKLTLNTVIPWIKKDIDILPLISLSKVNLDDIVIISKADHSISEVDLSNYTFLIYEDFFQEISVNIIKEYQYRYDYYYLKNALIKAQDQNVKTIITGSSYGLFGIHSSLLSNEINLSLSSQDLYYSLKGIYHVCNKNPNIKNIVLCVGYYYFFTDLSKTKNQNEIMRIPKVYEPLFHDTHNCTLLPPKAEILFHSRIFDIENILNIYSNGEYEKGYFNQERPQKNYATQEWDDNSKDWIHLNIQEKMDAGIRRTTLHNKNIKRKNSFKENVIYFQQLVDYCTIKNKNLLLVVTPTTKYYLDYLDSNFKEYFYDVLNQTDGVIHLLDLSEDETYLDDDFIDTDHLSDSGAVKLTATILDTLQVL